MAKTTIKEIQGFCDSIARDFRPRRITLFGSHARGNARSDSDVDLLVEMPFRGSGVALAADMIKKIEPHFAVDIVVRTPKQIRERLAWGDSFLEEALSQGKVLYESADN